MIKVKKGQIINGKGKKRRKKRQLTHWSLYIFPIVITSKTIFSNSTKYKRSAVKEAIELKSIKWRIK